MDILKGAVSILLVVLPLLISQVREFWIKRYQSSLDKALEDRKSKNERKNYVSKVRFDKEFEIYSELSELFFELVAAVNSLIPAGYTQVPADPEVAKKHGEEN